MIFVALLVTLILGVKVLHISCNTATHGLPDMSTLSPRALDVHTYQVNHSCLCYNY